MKNNNDIKSSFIDSRIDGYIDNMRQMNVPNSIDDGVMNHIGNRAKRINFSPKTRSAIWVAAVAASLVAGIMLGNIITNVMPYQQYSDELVLLNDMELEGFDVLFNE